MLDEKLVMNATRSSFLVLALLACAPVPALAQAWQQYVDVADAGWEPGLVAQARAMAEKARCGAVMLIHRGKVVVAWGDVQRRFKCHSVRKSLLSALYGIHVDEGNIDVNATLEELEIDDLQALTEHEKKACILDLLRARSGVYHPAAKETPDMNQNRPARGSHSPGEHFWYNNWDFNTLCPIFEQETGAGVFEEFEVRIAGPLGMEDFRRRDAFYQYEPSRSMHPAYAFRLSARDLARVGQMFLNHGRWNGEQIVPEAWVQESTDSHTKFADGDGYGYMWWVHPPRVRASSRYPALDKLHGFAARGTGGQFLLVIPEAQIVYVHRGDTDNGRRVPGSTVWGIAELLMQAKQSDPRPDVAFQELESTPFPGPPPPLPDLTAIEIKPEAMQPILGRFGVGLGQELRFWVHEERLFLTTPEGGEVELFPESASRFFAKAADLQFEFSREEDDQFQQVLIRFEGQVGTALRVPGH